MGVTNLFSLFFFILMHNGVHGTRHHIAQEDSFQPAYDPEDNKHVVKSIEVAGHIYDCVDILKQKSLSHPLLKDHVLQRHPSSYPEDLFHQEKTSTSQEKTSTLHSDFAYINCPEDTVPIQRKLENEGSLNLLAGLDEHYDQNDEVTHYMVDRHTTLGVYFGGKAAINIYKTPDIDPGQYVFSKLLMSDNSDITNNRISAGWAIEPNAYGDAQPRLTIVWSASSTRCVNLNCPGFVQVHSQIALGAPFTNVSVIDGPQFHVIMTVFKDPDSHYWWFVLGDGETRKPIGYWPNKLFTTLVELARYVKTAGHVGTPVGVPSPQMGSGKKASEGYGRAAYFRGIKTIDGNNRLLDPSSWYTESARLGTCDAYEIGPLAHSDDGPYFFYGGPGFCLTA